jgi:predicted enzyme related to lactoylglutathione lyase
MRSPAANPLVHLELHTGNLPRATAFYTRLFEWPPARIEACSRSYLSVDMGDVGGGMVECATQRSLWLPYVQVPAIGQATRRAEELGARVLLGPREGPGGWRSVVSAPDGAEVAFWQAKPTRPPGPGRSG